MKRITLQGIRLRNFKGARELELSPAGADLSLYGDNGVGKTTVADAIAWLLYGKDSTGRADFELKTIGSDGQVIHGLDHEVEAELSIDGRPLALRKVYREKWTKRRGSAVSELTGNTTDHFIDGVPVQMKEFVDRIQELAPEGTFQLLTDPAHFAERMHWQERRDLVLEVCGDVSDAEVVAANAELVDLPTLIGDRSLAEARKVAEARRRELNRELDRIPVRIDEVERGLPDVDGLEEEALQAQLDGIREHRVSAEEEKTTIVAGGQAAELRKQIRQIEAQLLEIDNAARAGQQEMVADHQRGLADATRQRDDAAAALRRLEGELREIDADVTRLDQQLGELRDRWIEVDSRMIGDSLPADVCPTCSQPLPADQVEEAHSRAIAELNSRKSAELEQIDAEGTRLRDRRDARLDRRVLAEGELAATASARAEAQERVDELAERTAEARRAADRPVTDSPERTALSEQLRQLSRRVESAASDTAAQLADVGRRIRQHDEEIATLERQLAWFGQRRKAQARIQELRDQERALSREHEQIERLLHLLDVFVRTKVELLEERINSHFEIASFRLFAELVNGGISEVCEVAVDGVPWRSLNHGARIRAGLDVIRTLQRHLELAPPVVIDQGESVTSLPDMDCQVLRLVVSAEDQQLRAEFHEHEAAA